MSSLQPFSEHPPLNPILGWVRALRLLSYRDTHISHGGGRKEEEKEERRKEREGGKAEREGRGKREREVGWGLNHSETKALGGYGRARLL